MLSNKGFDLWADGYDSSVGLSDDENSYPFAGYKSVLGIIYRAIMEKSPCTVLDIGFGTGTLAAKLYENGCTIYGQDFSARMIALARPKMPAATLCQGDFTNGLVPELSHLSYDFIVSTYALHHLTAEQKLRFISELCSRLKPGGALLIGDIAFETAAELDACRKSVGYEWDDDEIYIAYDEIKRFFPAMTFEKISFCAGILTLTKPINS